MYGDGSREETRKKALPGYTKQNKKLKLCLPPPVSHLQLHHSTQHKVLHHQRYKHTQAELIFQNARLSKAFSVCYSQDDLRQHSVKCQTKP